MGTGLQLVAERIDVSMDVPGGTQSFNLDQNTSKFQINNTANPISGGADSKIILESRNSYLGGFRWTHDTIYQSSPTLPGTYTLYKFIGDDQTGVPIFSFDSSGNATVNNNLTVSGTLFTTTLDIPALIIVAGTTQTFEYDGNHFSDFVLKNTYAATVGNPSTVNLDFTNSTTGGYRFIHTSQSTDPVGLGQFKLQIYNNVGTTEDVFNVSIDGGGNPVLDYYGTFNSHGSNFFNIGGGISVFYADTTFNTAVTFNSPISMASNQINDLATPSVSSDAATKGYVDSSISSAAITLTGAVSGSGTSPIATTLNSSISVSGPSQTFQYSGNYATHFTLNNTFAATVGNPSTINLDFTNSTTGGYRFIHTSQSTDPVGLGQFKLQIYNNVGTTEDVFNVSIDGGGNPVLDYYGTFNSHGSNFFNIGGGISVFYADTTFNTAVTFNSPISMASNQINDLATPSVSSDAATKGYVDSSISSAAITLTGAVSGSGTSPIATTLNSSISVSGPSQTFQYSGNYATHFTLNNTFAATVGNPSTINLDFTNSTTGGYRFIHTSQSTDPVGLGQFKLQIYNNVGTTEDVFNVSIDGGGNPVLDYYGTFNSHGSNFFNIGGGISVFYADTTFNTAVTFNSPISMASNQINDLATPSVSSDAATKGYVDSSISSAAITLTGAVSGSGTSPIATTLNSSISVSGPSQTFQYSGNYATHFTLNNTFAATVGNPSTINLDFTNSTTGGYRFIHTSQSTDPVGLGQFKLQIYNNVGTTEDVFNVSIDGGGNPVLDYYGTFNSHGSNFFNIGGGVSAFFADTTFNAAVTFNSPISMASNQINDLATPSVSSDAATKGYVDSNYVALAGSTMTGALILNADPTVALGAVTKQYADAISQGLTFKDSCYAGTTANLSATYVNGVSGVGATLTNSGSLAAFAVDGTSPALNSRILVKNQSTAFQNGIYTLTTIGSGAIAWILTRSTDYNSASQIHPGDFILVDNGTVNASTSWVETATVTTMGTSSISFSQFGSSAELTASYILQTSNAALPNAQVLGSLATGIVKNTTSTGVLSIATAGTDYFGPDGSGNFLMPGQIILTKSTSTDSIILNNTNGSSTSNGIEFQNNGSIAFQVGFNNSTNNSYIYSSLSSNILFGINSVEVMRISVDGQLGIGTTTPHSPLHISNSLATNRIITLWEVNNNQYQYYGFGIGDNTLAYNVPGVTTIHAFYAGTSSSTSQELARITATGTTSNSGCIGINVGTTPSAGCHVIGGVQNVSGEDTCFRAQSSTIAAKMEFDNTGASGRLYEIRAVSNGNLDIVDRTAGAERLIINTTGVGIFGSPDTTFSVTTGSADKPGGGSWGSFSDGRIKNIIGEYKHGLKEILQVNPKIYKYTEESKLTSEDLEKDRVGIIAQDIETILPECIELMEARGFSDLRFYDSSPILYALINAVKELSQQIDHLNSTIH